MILTQTGSCFLCPALRDDLYFDVGCLLALSMVHGGPPVGFFSPALYQCLFNYPPNQPFSVTHMTPDTHLTRQVSRVRSTNRPDAISGTPKIQAGIDRLIDWLIFRS